MIAKEKSQICGTDMELDSNTISSQFRTREWVEKTRKIAKTLKIIMIICLPVPIFGAIIVMIIGPVYLNKFGYFLRSVKDLEKSNRLDYVNDIPINTSTFVGSKIDCGSRAMYFQKIHQIIAYEDVLWIYIKRQNNTFYGFTISSIETVEIWCRNKRHLSISAGRDDISQLINDYISKASPSLLVGYSAENAKQYSILKNS